MYIIHKNPDPIFGLKTSRPGNVYIFSPVRVAKNKIIRGRTIPLILFINLFNVDKDILTLS